MGEWLSVKPQRVYVLERFFLGMFLYDGKVKDRYNFLI